MRNFKRSKRVITGCLSLLFLMIGGLSAQQRQQELELPPMVEKDYSGKFEIGIFGSFWTIDPFINAFESDLSEELGDEIRDEIIDDLIDDFPGLVKSDFEDTFAFDSGGPNYGLEMRFYPQGRAGGFSVGLTLEKVKMRISAEGNVRQNFTDGTYGEAEGTGEINLDPFFTSLSVRWDFKPAWRITPYYVMGLGVAALTGDISYEYSGIYRNAQGDVTVSGSEVKTLIEAEEEGDFNIPNIIPLLQLNFGVRFAVTPQLMLRGEGGFYDGFIFRVGVSGRF